MAEITKKELTKAWKEKQKTDYILSKEEVQNLFDYLEEQLDTCDCDHTLRYTEKWIKDNISAELSKSVISEITDMGGYCDCEVLFNCYEDYDVE